MRVTQASPWSNSSVCGFLVQGGQCWEIPIPAVCPEELSKAHHPVPLLVRLRGHLPAFHAHLLPGAE